LDGSTHFTNLAILLVFVRYINEDTGIAEEELLFFRPLKNVPLEKIYSISQMPTLLKTK
jgi:hypothetical protein